MVPDTTVALAAELSSSDTVWFIRISNETMADHEMVDDFNHKISAGNRYVSGHYFFKESIVYPFVTSEQKSGKLFISNEKIVD